MKQNNNWKKYTTYKQWISAIVRIIAWETVSQIALRNCSSEVEECVCVCVCVCMNFKVRKYIESSKRLLLTKQDWHFKLMILVLCCVWKNTRNWSYWNSSLDMHLNYLLLPKHRMFLSYFLPWIPLRIHCPQLIAVNCALTLCITEWWATLFARFVYGRKEVWMIQRSDGIRRLRKIFTLHVMHSIKKGMTKDYIIPAYAMLSHFSCVWLCATP